MKTIIFEPWYIVALMIIALVTAARSAITEKGFVRWLNMFSIPCIIALTVMFISEQYF